MKKHSKSNINVLVGPPGYSLKKPAELPKYCQVRVGSFWKFSMNTSFSASDM